VSRARRVAVVGGGVLAAVVVALVCVFGLVGIEQTVSAGSQPRVCGVTVGVTSTDQTVRLLGASEETLAPGDRVRLSPLCVVEIVGIESAAASDEDGAGARVQLRWRWW